MLLDNFFHSLNLVYPELSLFILLMVIILMDLTNEKLKAAIPYVLIFGLVITSYFTISQYGFTGLAFKNMSVTGLLALDPFASFFKVLILFSSLLIVLFSIVSEEIKTVTNRRGEYYTLLVGMILGMFLMVSASDLIMLYLSIELVSLSSYVLAGFIKTSNKSAEASLKYIIYGAVASGFMLFGISLIYGLTGTTGFYALNHIVNQIPRYDLLFNFSILLVMIGLGYKISAVPFHFWTPDVYEGSPTTITAYLSVASKAAGFALLIRFVKILFISDITEQGFWQLADTFHWSYFIMIISILTMTVGNFAALWQQNIKRMLAYSSIAHAGYMLAAFSVMSEQGVNAILIYFIVYILTNLGAFLVIILISNKIGKEDIDDYDGLGYQMPFIGVALTIFLVSLTGLPPTAGFIGKFYVFISLLDARNIPLAIIAVLNSVVSLYYYVRVIKHLYLNKPKDEKREYTFSITENILLLLLVIPVIVFGLYFNPLQELAKYSSLLFGF